MRRMFFGTPRSTESSSSNMTIEMDGPGEYIPPATPEQMNDLLNSARSQAMMRDDPYFMNPGTSKIISLVRNLNLEDTSSEESITSPMTQSIVVGGVAIDEKPFGYRPMLGNFKLFAYKHKKPYFFIP